MSPVTSYIFCERALVFLEKTLFVFFLLSSVCWKKRLMSVSMVMQNIVELTLFILGEGGTPGSLML